MTDPTPLTVACQNAACPENGLPKNADAAYAAELDAGTLQCGACGRPVAASDLPNPLQDP